MSISTGTRQPLDAVIEQAVAWRTAELKQSNENLEAFARELAHELRTPIGQVAGIAQLLLQRMDDAGLDDGRRWLELQLKAAQQMGDTVQTLLDLARSTQAPLPLAAIDLSELCRAAVETAADAILVLDEGGRILFANAATARLFRYAVSALTGLPVTALIPHASLESGVRELVGAARDGEELPIELSIQVALPQARDPQRRDHLVEPVGLCAGVREPQPHSERHHQQQQEEREQCIGVAAPSRVDVDEAERRAQDEPGGKPGKQQHERRDKPFHRGFTSRRRAASIHSPWAWSR